MLGALYSSKKLQGSTQAWSNMLTHTKLMLQDANHFALFPSTLYYNPCAISVIGTFVYPWILQYADKSQFQPTANQVCQLIEDFSMLK